MKFLVFGFSVTAETGGFVEQCAAKHPENEIKKVAIGGMQPNHARHLIEGILREHRPDALILEIATAIYRLRPKTDAQISDHVTTMEAIFDACKRHSIRCGILILPQVGIREDDWIPTTDSELARKYNLPIINIDLNEQALRDNVHPNAIGKELYAEALYNLITKVADTAPDFSRLEAKKRFDAVKVEDMDIDPPEFEFRDFARAEFRAKILSLPADKSFLLSLPRKVNVVGLVVLMGPTVGTIKVRTGTRNTAVNCFDRHCYYERINGRTLGSEVTDKVWLIQQSDLPTEELIKGDRNVGARIGGVSHVLFEE
ncbi:hypothetical protein [Pseudotabrizicola sp. 4114]|uniref:SGNH/GDSL hydrolase family protein n=1 Tax=Pseudotabrizicola sp. 4114 TaxID=2817731 RepID=UPI0028566537|nr:hypothetical protein [Pseudorhodobacter sp. 4114]